MEICVRFASHQNGESFENRAAIFPLLLLNSKLKSLKSFLKLRRKVLKPPEKVGESFMQNSPSKNFSDYV
jgi:hypothetical protein